LIFGKQDRGRVAGRIGHDVEFLAVLCVVDRDELFAMAHGVLVIGPLRRADIAPIALYVAVDETLRISCDSTSATSAPGVTTIQRIVNRGEMTCTEVLLSL
jgi:hypothetical protein